MNKREAREWAHWWNVRGHTAVIEFAGRKNLFHCWLQLERAKVTAI
jgi:hypothetical protein